ncbi:MAG: hypothetical protein ACPGTU_15185 [Myxococcota bacterium]
MMATDTDTKKRQRILRISKLNAWSITCIAGVFTLLGLLSLSLAGILVGAAVTSAGLAEIKGHRKFAADEEGARIWMSLSQLWLILSVLTYCGWRVYSLDTTDPFAILGDSTSILELTSTMGISQAAVTELFIKAYLWTYGLVAVLTCVFQGGLSIYYWVNIKQ